MVIIPTIDNLIIYIKDVHIEAFDILLESLDRNEWEGEVSKVYYYIGKGASDYHHNLKIGEGSGAIHIGYKHNMSPENEDSYTLRLELNPNKSEKYLVAVETINKILAPYKKLIRGYDVAFDIDRPIKSLMPLSLTGKKKGQFNDTIYFGSPGKHGRLKIYDKKKELEDKQGIIIKEDELTRIEYSVRLQEPITIQIFEVMRLSINEEFQISVLNMDKLEGLVKACVLAIRSGEMDIKELTRTYQNKTKKALQDMELLDLDHVYYSAITQLADSIKRYIILNSQTKIYAQL